MSRHGLKDIKKPAKLKKGPSGLIQLRNLTELFVYDGCYRLLWFAVDELIFIRPGCQWFGTIQDASCQ